MSVAIETMTIDCVDPERVARFWSALLGYEIVPHPTTSIRIASPDGTGPALLFTPAGRAKDGKNPWHFDLRPDDQQAAVDRALALGAVHVDIGQSGDEGWVVLADPEGNEFCILRATEAARG